MFVPPPSVAVLGVPALAARLGAGSIPVVPASEAAVVVIGGDVGSRARIAREAVSAGRAAFLLWPPGVSVTEAVALDARAEEAGVEVGVARPLGVGGLLAGRPETWTARLVALSLVAAPGGPLDAAGWTHRLGGALDVCATLVASTDVARLDAEAERDGPAIRAAAVAVRFRNGAFAQIDLRASALVEDDAVALYASGPGGRVEARSLAGPLCVETDGRPAFTTPTPDPEAAEVLDFLDAVADGRRAPHGLDDAVATLRLVERVQERLR